jgi:hypothetical protein
MVFPGHSITPIGFVAAMALVTLPTLGRDLDGRYKNSPLHDWFEHPASGKGPCCSYAALLRS